MDGGNKSGGGGGDGSGDSHGGNQVGSAVARADACQGPPLESAAPAAAAGKQELCEKEPGTEQASPASGELVFRRLMASHSEGAVDDDADAVGRDVVGALHGAAAREK